MRGKIRITGLNEFRRALRQIDRDAPKGLRKAGNKAADIVVAEAKPRVPLGPGKGGHAKSSIRAASTASAARVRGGGRRFPYYGWLDFGGPRNKPRPPERPYFKSGRYIWAAFAAERDRVEGVLRDELTDVARQAGARAR